MTRTADQTTATPFTKSNLTLESGYVYFRPEGGTYADRRFVARFKYAARSSARPFITFLCRNFTAEEFFGRIDAGEAPFEIVKSKGFILSHVKRWLREGGYPVTPAGYAQFTADQVAKYAAGVPR